MKIENRNWVDIISKEFSHPATVLWRSIEVRYLGEAIKKYNPVLPVLDLGCAEGKIGSILFKERCLFGLDNCWDLIRQNQKTDTYKPYLQIYTEESWKTSQKNYKEQPTIEPGSG